MSRRGGLRSQPTRSHSDTSTPETVSRRARGRALTGGCGPHRRFDMVEDARRSSGRPELDQTIARRLTTPMMQLLADPVQMSHRPGKQDYRPPVDTPIELFKAVGGDGARSSAIHGEPRPASPQCPKTRLNSLGWMQTGETSKALELHELERWRHQITPPASLGVKGSQVRILSARRM